MKRRDFLRHLLQSASALSIVEIFDAHKAYANFNVLLQKKRVAAGGTADPTVITYDNCFSSQSATNSTSVNVTSSGGNVLVIASACAQPLSSSVTISGAGLKWNGSGSFRWAYAGAKLTGATITASTASGTSTALVVSLWRGPIDSERPLLAGGGGSPSVEVSGCNGDHMTARSNAHVFATQFAFCSTAAQTISVSAGYSVLGQANTLGYGTIAHIKANSLTANYGTEHSWSTDWATNDTWNAMPGCYSIQPIQAGVPEATYWQMYKGDNATGDTWVGAAYNTSGPNELLLIAVSYRHASAISTPAGMTLIRSVTQTGTYTVTTNVYHAFHATQQYREYAQFTLPASCKATVTVVCLRGTLTTGTNGADAIEGSEINSGGTANPSVTINPVNSSRVVTFLGHANTTVPTASTGYTVQGTNSSSGGGSATTKVTTSVMSSNAVLTGSTTPTFTLAASDWTAIAVAVK
jgi:hypothetical protein